MLETDCCKLVLILAQIFTSLLISEHNLKLQKKLDKLSFLFLTSRRNTLLLLYSSSKKKKRAIIKFAGVIEPELVNKLAKII